MTDVSKFWLPDEPISQFNPPSLEKTTIPDWPTATKWPYPFDAIEVRRLLVIEFEFSQLIPPSLDIRIAPLVPTAINVSSLFCSVSGSDSVDIFWLHDKNIRLDTKILMKRISLFYL